MKVNMKNIQIILQKINKAPTRIFSILAGMGLILGIITDFKFEPTEQNKGLWFVIFILLWLLISVSVEFLFYAFNRIKIKLIAATKPAAIPITDSLVAYFEELKRQNNSDELIIRWGLGVSKPLWVSHSYQILKNIGQIVFESAKKSNDEKAQIYVLINNIGWTNVELLEYSDAITNIKEGITLLNKENNRDYYLLAKAHRHLVSINIRTDNMDKKEECEIHLKLCEEATNNYIESWKETTNTYELNKQNRLRAEFNFTKATYEHKSGNNDKALSFINEAEELFAKIPNKDWKVKIMARKGDILLALNRDKEALDSFNKGKDISIRATLNKPLVKNLIGLGNYFIKQGEYKNAKDNLELALTKANEIGMYYEIEIIEKKLKIVDNKMKK